MEVQGKIIAVLPERGGTSARGTEWKAQEYVLETHEQRPKKMAFEVFGSDRIARFNIEVGQEVNVAFDIEAREWNGRWFNSIRAFDVRLVVAGDPTAMGAAPAAIPQAATSAPVMNSTVSPAAGAAAPADAAAPAGAPTSSPVADFGSDDSGDLPF